MAISAEIFAWKTPLSAVAPEELNVPSVTRLEKPPEASPFFEPKDELWDIATLMSRPDRALSDAPEWVVWNATSGRIVAKVSWTAFVEIHHKWNLQNPPVQCRVKIDVYQVAADGSPPDSSKPPERTLTAVTRAGQKTSATYSESGANIGLECETTFSNDGSLIDLRTLISVSLPDGPKSKFDTSVTLLNELPIWLAREFDGKNGIDIMVTVTSELVDGTPFSEAVLRQEGNGIMPFPGEIRHGKSGNIAIGEKVRLIWYPVPIMELLVHIGVVKFPEDDEAEDPFAAITAIDPEKNIFDESKLKTITVPEILAPHVPSSVFDIGDFFKDQGIHISKEDLIGYDYKNQRVFFYSSDTNELYKFQKLCELLVINPRT